MIDTRHRLFTLPAQVEGSTVIVRSDLPDECSLICLREGVSDDYQIETAIAAQSTRLGEGKCGGYVEACGFQNPFPRAQKRLIVGNGEDRQSPIHRTKYIEKRNFGLLSSWIVAYARTVKSCISP